MTCITRHPISNLFILLITPTYSPPPITPQNDSILLTMKSREFCYGPFKPPISKHKKTSYTVHILTKKILATTMIKKMTTNLVHILCLYCKFEGNYTR